MRIILGDSVRRRGIADSNSKNAVNFSAARTTNRFPLSRCASAIQIVRPLESIADTQPQLRHEVYSLSTSPEALELRVGLRNFTFFCAGVAELADALDSKASDLLHKWLIIKHQLNGIATLLPCLRAFCASFGLFGFNRPPQLRSSRPGLAQSSSNGAFQPPIMRSDFNHSH
jgi:hypothetical protein